MWYASSSDSRTMLCQQITRFGIPSCVLFFSPFGVFSTYLGSSSAASFVLSFRLLGAAAALDLASLAAAFSAIFAAFSAFSFSFLTLRLRQYLVT